MRARELVDRWLPIVSSLRDYDLGDGRQDLAAGLTTGVLLVPQAMAYAMLAGLPPIIGLYASTIPVFAYALFGSSRQLAIGPVAIVSLLVATGVGGLASVGTDDYLAYAMLLMLMVGLFQLGLGLARAGFLVNFLSRPVIAGFTSAAALIIACSQLEHLLGLDLERSSMIHEILIGAVRNIESVHLATFGVGAAAIAILVVLRIFAPRVPRALVVVVAGTLAVWGFELQPLGVEVVGEVPAGLPAPSLPALDFGAARNLWPTAVTIGLVGFMEAISVSKVFAQRNGYELDANRELVGIGVANLAGCFFRGYPIAGAFSRTAVNADAGARTVVASLVTGAVVVATLLFFTPLFYYLPKAVLAAIIMVAVSGLIDVEEMKNLWRVDKRELGLLALTFVATLGLGVERGILVGLGTSVLYYLIRTARPDLACLGRVPGTDRFRDVERDDEAEHVPGVLILRVEGSLYFGSVSRVKETFWRVWRARKDDESTPMRAAILDATRVDLVDADAEAALHELCRSLEAEDATLHIVGLEPRAHEMLERSGLVDELGEDHLHGSVAEAANAVYANQPRAG